MSGEGQTELNNLTSAGFSSDEVNAWQTQRRSDLSAAGFNNVEVDDYFGQPSPDKTNAALSAHFDDNISAAATEAKGDGTTPAKPFTLDDAFSAGWQHSTAGLLARQKGPDMTLPENNTWYQRLAFNSTSLAGDIPAGVAGFLVGGAAGAETGPGAVITGTAGAFALPAALRATMMDAYGKGEFHSAGDFISRASGILYDSAKAYATGAATAVGGLAAKAGLAAAGAGAVTTTLGTTAAEIGSMVTTSKALEGQLPGPSDFLDGAMTLAAFKTVPYMAGKISEGAQTVGSSDFGQAAGAYVDKFTGNLKDQAAKVADTLRNIYAQTNKQPADVVKDAAQDPTVHQDVMLGQVPDAYKGQIDPSFQPKEPTAPATPAPPQPGTLEAAQKNILDKVEVGGSAPKQKLNFDDFYTAVVDNMNPLKLAVDEMTGGKGAPVGENPYALARLTRGFYGKADQFLTQSPYDFKTYANTGESLKSILTPFKDDLQGVRAYVVAKRSLELRDRGIDSGIDPIAAEKVVNDSGGKYDAVAQKLTGYQDTLTKYLRDSGVLSKDAYDAMRDANKSYVPFYRVFDTDGITGPGKGFSTFNPIKNIKGSDRGIIDPIESIIKNTYAYMALADRNEVAQKFIGLAKKSANPEDFIEKVPTPVKPVTVQDNEMKAFMQAHGIDNVPEDLLTVFRAARQPLADDEIAVYNKGDREVYKVDPEVANVFKASDKETTNWVFRILASPTGLFRAGVTLSPDFFPRNLIRDQFTALINSKSGFVPLLDTVRGAASMIKQDDSYQNWLKSGGANATMVALDRDYIQNNVMKLDEETNFRDSAWNVIKKPVDALRIVSELAENATRLGEFKKDLGGSTDKGDIQRAGLSSREATLDFARIGAKTSAVNQLVAFWNANVQDIDRFARTVKDDPMGTAAKVAASIIAPSVALWYANHDDPRYKDVPAWQKDLFWLVMTKDHIYRIPKPYGPGVLFGSGIERFLDWAVDNDHNVMKHFASDLMGTLTPGTVPTVAQPIIEQWANKSLFTGSKIIPSSTEELLPQVQYQPYTTQTAQALGRMIGTLPGMNSPGSAASPAIVENYIRGWSGGLGMYALQIADTALRKTGILPDPIMPASTLADTPFVKAFVVRYPSAGAQPIQDFYDTYTSHKQVIDTVQYLAKQGDFAAAVKLAGMDPSAMMKLDGIKSGLTNAQRMIQIVTKDPSMTPTDKRQLIDTTYYQMINMARQGNEVTQQIDNAMAK